MKSPSRSLVIILVSFMINIAFFSSNPTFTSSSEDNKLFTSFNAFPGIMTLALFVILSKLVLSVRVWYPSDSYWPLLHWLNLHIIAVCAAIGGAIWLIVTIYYLYRVFRQIDEIVDAAGKMVSWPEKPLEMPRSLEGLRNEMAAKEAEQKKNDLIVYLAHDLKTPLTSVIGYLSLLRDEPQISEKLRERYTEIALNKAERLEELINEFFDITRFNLSVMTLEKETIHFSRMLEQIVSEFEPILQEKRLSVESVIEKDIILSGDADKLERVFDNLLRNAVNYSYPDTVIHLLMKRMTKEHKVLIRVQNHGRTIAKEKLEHIFEQFFRVDASRSSATGGSGLGLAIARQIVEMHYGQIRAESADETIVFEVELPCE